MSIGSRRTPKNILFLYISFILYSLHLKSTFHHPQKFNSYKTMLWTPTTRMETTLHQFIHSTEEPSCGGSGITTKKKIGNMFNGHSYHKTKLSGFIRSHISKDIHKYHSLLTTHKTLVSFNKRIHLWPIFLYGYQNHSILCGTDEFKWISYLTTRRRNERSREKRCRNELNDIIKYTERHT